MSAKRQHTDDDAKPKSKKIKKSDKHDAFLQNHSITIHSDIPVVPLLSFADLDIHPHLSAAFKGFESPTPIQACTWPPAFQRKDVIGIAQTGR
jgi:ATP-dependent RNA helicase DBP3